MTEGWKCHYNIAKLRPSLNYLPTAPADILSPYGLGAACAPLFTSLGLQLYGLTSPIGEAPRRKPARAWQARTAWFPAGSPDTAIVQLPLPCWANIFMTNRRDQIS